MAHGARLAAAIVCACLCAAHAAPTGSELVPAGQDLERFGRECKDLVGQPYTKPYDKDQWFSDYDACTDGYERKGFLKPAITCNMCVKISKTHDFTWGHISEYRCSSHCNKGTAKHFDVLKKGQKNRARRMSRMHLESDRQMSLSLISQIKPSDDVDEVEPDFDAEELLAKLKFSELSETENSLISDRQMRNIEIDVDEDLDVNIDEIDEDLAKLKFSDFLAKLTVSEHEDEDEDTSVQETFTHPNQLMDQIRQEEEIRQKLQQETEEIRQQNLAHTRKMKRMLGRGVGSGGWVRRPGGWVSPLL